MWLWPLLEKVCACMYIRTNVVATVATLCACVVSGEHSFRVGV